MTEQSKRLWELVKTERLDEVNDHNQGVIKLSGRHDSEKILATLLVVDPDLQENSTVTCQFDEQFIIFRSSVKKNFKLIKKYSQNKLLKLQPLLIYSDEETRRRNGSLRIPENSAANLTTPEDKNWKAIKEKSYIIKTTTGKEQNFISNPTQGW
ncbi:unnamed protein product [Dicrocoelium dendriticum]|nr:unnamed protein product [Dicrocoelium dendriticum]